MAESIQKNAFLILSVLSIAPRNQIGRAEVDGKLLVDQTNLSPADINDAISLLADSGYVERQRAIGFAPFHFRTVYITPRGRYEIERLKETEREKQYDTNANKALARPPIPVGSPYGFHDEDWETVTLRKTNSNELFIVLGYQFKSNYYDSSALRSNIETSFKLAVSEYNNFPDAIQVTLVFRSLEAGYGEHLFNEIARDIISADIAVFETSDLNSNVMLEMGVALTWGVRVLPIKVLDRPKPPSDISGQTWADYEDSGKLFIDKDHQSKLMRMVERAARTKAKS